MFPACPATGLVTRVYIARVGVTPWVRGVRVRCSISKPVAIPYPYHGVTGMYRYVAVLRWMPACPASQKLQKKDRPLYVVVCVF